MQVVDRKNIEKRILFYLSKMYSKTIHSGNDYQKLEKCIAILFTDYDIDATKHIPKYITKWNIREEDYQKVILTDAMEVIIIEMKKYDKFKANDKYKGLNSWIEFILNPEVVDMSNKEIQKARKALEEVSADEHEQYLAELRQKYIMDQKAIEDAGYDKGFKAGSEQGLKQGIQKGVQQGIRQGIQQGIEQGKCQKNLEIAKKMLLEKIDLAIISKVTGLSIDELKKLN